MPNRLSLWRRLELRCQFFGTWPTPWWARPLRTFGRALYVTRRYFEGARPVDCGDPSCGAIRDSGIDIAWSGMCPVQGEGAVRAPNGEEWACYFHSRGEGWQFHVYPFEGVLFRDDVFVYERSPYFWPDGGYVSAAVVERCVREAVAAWRASL